MRLKNELYIIKRKRIVLVTYHYEVRSDSHAIMSKREVQEALKSEYAYVIAGIQELKITPVKSLLKKYLLPKNWQKINSTSTDYHTWKQISESDN